MIRNSRHTWRRKRPRNPPRPRWNRQNSFGIRGGSRAHQRARESRHCHGRNLISSGVAGSGATLLTTLVSLDPLYCYGDRMSGRF